MVLHMHTTSFIWLFIKQSLSFWFLYPKLVYPEFLSLLYYYHFVDKLYLTIQDFIIKELPKVPERFYEYMYLYLTETLPQQLLQYITAKLSGKIPQTIYYYLTEISTGALPQYIYHNIFIPFTLKYDAFTLLDIIPVY